MESRCGPCGGNVSWEDPECGHLCSLCKKKGPWYWVATAEKLMMAHACEFDRFFTTKASQELLRGHLSKPISKQQTFWSVHRFDAESFHYCALCEDWERAQTRNPLTNRKANSHTLHCSRHLDLFPSFGFIRVIGFIWFVLCGVVWCAVGWRDGVVRPGGVQGGGAPGLRPIRTGRRVGVQLL